MEFEHEGATYRVGRMNVFDQWNVARRLMPILASLPSKAEANGDALTPLFQAIGKATDDDSNYILHKCLAVVSRKDSGGNWVRVMATGGNALMFEDINMFIMIRLTVAVIKENMGDFFTQAVSGDLM
jgi:hypothetical protein